MEFETAKLSQNYENLIHVVAKLFGDGKKKTNRITPQTNDEAEVMLMRMMGRG